MPTPTTHDSKFASAVGAFCTEQVPDAQQQRSSFPNSEIWAAVAKTGTSLWLDTGDIDAAREMWVQEFVALTTNNTLLNKEVQKGIYDALVPNAAKLVRGEGASSDAVVQEVAFVLNAVHGLKLVRTFDADVSVELHTAISNDAEASYQYGKRFHAICPDRFIVKVPLTPAGLLAARRLSDDGVRLNFTLGFSARQNWLIASLARPTWVNVFMGRINAFLSDNQLGDGKNAGEKATLASQRGLRRVKNQGGADVKQIGASMRNGNQVDDLLGLDVYTMPIGAAKGFLDLNPAHDAITDKTGNDPSVTFANGVDAEGDHLNCFWDIDNKFETAAANAAGLNAKTATADDVLQTLRDSGAGDLFPQFTADDSARIANEGKIPVYKSWVDKVRAGTASWDGALTAAALASFTQDQNALDDRIRGFIG
ncbi:MAG: transaldolase family protein [Planctomycetota bacterium]